MNLSLSRMQRRSDWSHAPAGEPSAERRLTWSELCRQPECHGCWVALRDCRYDARTGQAVEGVLVDFDEDLAALCDRVRDAHEGCAILFCA